MASFHVIQSFSQTTSQMSCRHRNMSNPITYLYVSRSEGDDSVDNILKKISNYHSALAKDFQNHHPMRSHRIFALLIRSD